MTEKEKYLNWVKEERKKGLKSINYTSKYALDTAFSWITGLPVPDREPVDEEKLYKELNAMNNAPRVPITDIL